MAKQGIRAIERDEILLPEHPEIYGLSGYVGCPYDCTWTGRWGEAICGSKEEAAYNGQSLGYPADWVANIEHQWCHPLVIENAVQLLEKELPIKRPSRVVMAPCSDPYPPIEKRLELTRSLIARLPGPVTVLTKSPTKLPGRDFDLLGAKGDSWFGVTLRQEDATAQECQISLLKEAKAQGLSSFVSLSPWLPGEEDPRRLISSLQDVTDYFLVISLNSGGRAVEPAFYEAKVPPLILWLVQEGLQDKVYVDRLLLSPGGIKYRSVRKRSEPWQWLVLQWGNALLGLKVSILIITIDHFAAIREKHGYSISNRILTEMETILRGDLEPPDVLAPGGGTHHILLAPQIDTEAARIKGENLCRLMEKHLFADEEQITATVSVGEAIFPDHGKSVEEIMSNAFIALDKARAQGGNRCITYSEDLTNDIGIEWPWQLMCDIPPFRIDEKRANRVDCSDIFDLLSNDYYFTSRAQDERGCRGVA